jgi:adenylate kinase family enzyme/gamma-glutamylcyclotransferase (GGCT)/AIG2-like uncharacterized protein YtfP
MKRVAVVGCSGSGKSRLARELGARLDLPVIHLDSHYWRAGWVPTPDAEWTAMQAGLFSGEDWIADGNFHSTLRHRIALADTVVFLDFPRAACLRGVLVRLLRQHGQVRSDMAPGCPERFDLTFLRWVWNFRRDVRPRTLDVLRDYESRGGRLITLRSRREVRDLLGAVSAARPTTTGVPRASLLYFAYGSNLSSARLRQGDRAPAARAAGAAALTGYTLRWHKRGQDGSGKCTVHATGAASDAVWGVVWEVCGEDLARLDAVEGPGYERVAVEVTAGDRKLDAFTYVARESHVQAGLEPAAWYRAMVVAGAREHGLPASWIRSLEGIRTGDRAGPPARNRQE